MDVCLDSPVIPTHPFKNKIFFNCPGGTQVVNRGTDLEFYLTFFVYSLKWGEDNQAYVKLEVHTGSPFSLLPPK